MLIKENRQQQQRIQMQRMKKKTQNEQTNERFYEYVIMCVQHRKEAERADQGKKENNRPSKSEFFN